jgi:hypothetical protein
LRFDWDTIFCSLVRRILYRCGLFAFTPFYTSLLLPNRSALDPGECVEVLGIDPQREAGNTPSRFIEGNLTLALQGGERKGNEHKGLLQGRSKSGLLESARIISIRVFSSMCTR